MPSHYTHGPDYLDQPKNKPKGQTKNLPLKKKSIHRHEKGHCPPGFRWNEKKKKCEQIGIGPAYKP